MNFYIWTVVSLIVGIGAHILKKVVERRKTEMSFSLKDWLTKYPYRTALVFIAGAVGYAGLLGTGQLTYVSAFMAGYMADSLGGAAE